MKKNILILFICCYHSAFIFAQQRWYVSAQASGANTGLSWTDAFGDLHQALAAAQSGDSIWVAQGVFYPTPGTDRNASFQLKSRVNLYGGFQGTENQLTQRDPQQYATILSGNIGHPDSMNDNSIHIVVGIGLEYGSVLDGFTIRDGNGEENYVSSGAAIYLLGTAEVPNTHLLIRNCNIVENRSYMGAGIGAEPLNPAYPGLGPYFVNFTLQNCLFENNYGQEFGGAIFKQGAIPNGDTLRIENCQFIHNLAPLGFGGAIYLEKAGSTALKLKNCHFERDSSWEGGAVVFRMEGSYGETTSFIADSCQFIKNWALNGAGISYRNQSLSANCIMNLHLNHCTFSENIARSTNGASFDAECIEQSNITIRVNNCIFSKNQSLGIRSTRISARLGSEADIEINNTIFTGNKGYHPDGFVFPLVIGTATGGPPSKVNTRINNCYFSGNPAGLFVGAGVNNQMLTTINNCLFYKNGTYGLVTATYPEHYLPGNIYYDSIIVRNSILWEPECTPTTLLYSNNLQFLNYYGFNIDHTLINLSEADMNTLPQFPINLGDHNLFAIDPQFVAPEEYNFQLQACSPAINAGDNLPAQTAGLLNDLAGQSRIQDGIIDLGVYESLPLQLDNPPALSASCISAATGSAQFSVPNACEPLQYQWNSGAQSGSELSQLAPGDYQLTISDAKGKQLLLNFSIGQSPAPQLMADIQSASGAAVANGAVQITVLSGAAPFQLLWSNNDTTNNPTGLLPGPYTLTLSDAAGCMYAYTYTVPFSSSSQEPGPDQASVWPNPSNGTLNIRWADADQWELFSMDGRWVMTVQPGDQPAFGHLPKGIYYYRFQARGRGQAFGKLIFEE